jgi:formylglycine-generating enzyme required for sulfatase activity
MARIAAYCIDRYEAQLATLDARGREKLHPPTERPTPAVRYLARSRAGAQPQAYLSRHEARAACEHADKRLCTLSEWYAACAGPAKRTYPYGDDERSGVCNSSKPHLLSRLFGSNPRRWRYDEQFNSSRLNQEPGFLAPTGSHPGCVTPEGVYDLVGNLHEWVSDEVDGTLTSKIDLIDDLRGRVIQRNLGHAIFMGGFYSTTAEHGPGCRFVTIGHEARYHDYSTGFRCCRDASQEGR